MQNKSKRITVTFDGKPYQVEISELSPDKLEVIVDGIHHLVNVDTADAELQPQTDDRPLTTSVQTASSSETVSPATASANQPNLVSAPMPGDIIEIAVKPGDQIGIGDKLLVLEAMKMKNVIRSPQAGKVTAVEVSAAQSVKYGDPLIRFG
ncbi:MAG: biotin/lipoyl-containing protein [Chloroflexota bacterium]